MTGRARGYTWPPFAPGNQINRTHGAFAADAKSEAAEVVADLFDPATFERYPVVCLLYAEVYVRWRRGLADIDQRGLVVGDGGDAKPHPLLPHVSSWEARLLDLSTRFGLDPKSETELARAQVEASRSVVDLEGIAARGRAALAETERRHALEAGSTDGSAAPGAASEAGADEDGGEGGAAPAAPSDGPVVGDDEEAW